MDQAVRKLRPWTQRLNRRQEELLLLLLVDEWVVEVRIWTRTREGRWGVKERWEG